MSLGKIGYLAYCEAAGWKSYNGEDLLANWDDLPLDVKSHWEVAALAVVGSIHGR